MARMSVFRSDELTAVEHCTMQRLWVDVEDLPFTLDGVRTGTPYRVDHGVTPCPLARTWRGTEPVGSVWKQLLIDISVFKLNTQEREQPSDPLDTERETVAHRQRQSAIRRAVAVFVLDV